MCVFLHVDCIFFFEYFGASPWIQMAITRIWLPQVQNGHVHVLLLVCLVKPQLPMHISILLRQSAMQNKIRTILILMADYIFAACRFIFTDFNYSNWMTDSYIFKREQNPRILRIDWILLINYKRCCFIPFRSVLLTLRMTIIFHAQGMCVIFLKIFFSFFNAKNRRHT